MDVIYLVVFFILGTIIGSFFNVVGFRLPQKQNFVKGRSYCPNCRHFLSFKEMIPVFSYIIQRGKCRHCGNKIPLFYPIIELSTGLLFATSFYSFGFSLDLLLALLIVSLLMIIIVSDLLYMIIPDEIIVVFGVLGIIVQGFNLGLSGLLFQLGSGILLFLVMFGLMKLGNAIFQKESLGGGDVKLMFLVGLFLHPILGVFTIFLSSFIALPVSLVLYFSKKENIIPFGPFIVIALLVLFLMKIDMMDVYNFLGM